MSPQASFHLRGESDPAVSVNATELIWPDAAGRTATVTTDLGWALTPLPAASPAAVDLVHLAAGAYMADRLSRRPAYFRRELRLTFNVLDPTLWTSVTLNLAADLLEWLTGDTWELEAMPARPMQLPGSFPIQSSEPVSLLSGGLDSFLGAIHALHAGRKPSFVGHKDTSTAVRQAQASTHRWLTHTYGSTSYTRIALSQSIHRREPTTRSRAFLFMAIGAACAVSASSTTLIVAENGYTSINLPLHANRGGALSTRSTHPRTFDMISRLFNVLGIDVTIENPFAWLTKGEAMAAVAPTAGKGWREAAGLTISCGKLGGNFFGGSPNLNCGLCVPCLVRRGTFIAAAVDDPTIYLFDQLSGSDKARLIATRRGDVEAVRAAAEGGADALAIDAGSWPAAYDLDRAEALVNRGLAELAAVPLP